MTDQGMTVPAGVTEALKAAAICHTCHPGIAATALLRAAADILCLSFEPMQVGEMMVEIVAAASAQHLKAQPLAGRA